MYVLKRMNADAIGSMRIVSPPCFFVFRHTHTVRESIPEGFSLLSGLLFESPLARVPGPAHGVPHGAYSRTPG